MNPENSWMQGPLVQIIRFLALVGLLTIFGIGLALGLFLADILGQL
jgi:hypothetical protein